MSLRMPLAHCFDYCFAVRCEIEKGESFIVVLVFQIVLAILSPLYFHINLRISLSVSVKKKKDSLDFGRDYIEFIDPFENYCHL